MVYVLLLCWKVSLVYQVNCSIVSILFGRVLPETVCWWYLFWFSVIIIRCTTVLNQCSILWFSKCTHVLFISLCSDMVLNISCRYSATYISKQILFFWLHHIVLNPYKHRHSRLVHLPLLLLDRWHILEVIFYECINMHEYVTAVFPELPTTISRTSTV